MESSKYTREFKLEALEIEKKELQAALNSPRPSQIRLPPQLPQIYRAKVEHLAKSLSDPGIRDEAAATLRGLIDEIRVTPAPEGVEAEVNGEIAKLVSLVIPETQQNQCSVKVGCGGRQPALLAAGGDMVRTEISHLIRSKYQSGL